MKYDATLEQLKADAIAKGLPRYFYEPIEEPLTPESAWERLPTYYEAHVAQNNAKVQGLLDGLPHAEAFVFFTDAHVRQNCMSSVPILRSILQNTDVQTVLYGGDTVSAWVTEETADQDLAYFTKAFSFAKPYMVRGNHDVYGKQFEYTSEGIVFSNEVVYDKIFKDGADRVCGEAGKTYYYFDHCDTKTRFIVIDTNEHLTPFCNEMGVWGCHVDVSREEIEWFIQLLSQTPREYALVVCGHIPFHRALRWAEPDACVFGDLIEAYNSKTTLSGTYRIDGREQTVFADFSGTEGKVILTLSGHGHFDDAFVSPTGCLHLEIHCDAVLTNNGGSPQKRDPGSVTENVLDVIIVDRDTNSIQTVRYGAGEDRGTMQLS